MRLTVFQSKPNHRAARRTHVALHSLATLSASRRVTRECASSHSRRSSRGPHSGHATRTRGTTRSTQASNTGRSRIRRSVQSCTGRPRRSHPEHARPVAMLAVSDKISQRCPLRVSWRQLATPNPTQPPSWAIQSPSATADPGLLSRHQQFCPVGRVPPPQMGGEPFYRFRSTFPGRNCQVRVMCRMSMFSPVSGMGANGSARRTMRTAASSSIG